MGDVTHLRTPRRYTKRQKATVVIAAEMSSVAAAAESSGIPESTVRYWMDDPELTELRAKTRVERAHAAQTMSLLVLAEIRRRLPEFEPRDLSVLYGIMVDKGQLMAGEATTRTEMRDITGNLPEADRELLSDRLDEWLRQAREATSDAPDTP